MELQQVSKSSVNPSLSGFLTILNDHLMFYFPSKCQKCVVNPLQRVPKALLISRSAVVNKQRESWRDASRISDTFLCCAFLRCIRFSLGEDHTEAARVARLDWHKVARLGTSQVKKWKLFPVEDHPTQGSDFQKPWMIRIIIIVE